MPIFTSTTKDDFLKNIWQQQPYIFRQCFTDITDIVDGNDLAGLACEDIVESRIIAGYEHDDEWSCIQGPFDEQVFAELPNNNWTLLVQGIDQYIEEAQALLTQFDFLPRWRLEDIMASYAPMGGGVGPHFDYYDVFLIQISGSREWRLGQPCDDKTPLLDNPSVKLLDTFTMESTHQLNPGDMLYIPAGKAHWGVASSADCITFSIGFRAPSEKELLIATIEKMVEQCAENHRYKDSYSSIDNNPTKINQSVQKQLSLLVESVDNDKMQSFLGQAFGELVTEPRYNAIEVVDESALSEVANYIDNIRRTNANVLLSFPPHTRLAFSDKCLFINGQSFIVDTYFAEAVCSGAVPYELLTEESIEYLLLWIQHGDILLDAE